MKRENAGLHAQQRGEAIQQALGLPVSDFIELKLQKLMRGTLNPDTKYYILRKVGNLVTDAAGKVGTPCKKGCSHCCHIPLEISQFEADLIGHLIGRKPEPIQHTEAAGPMRRSVVRFEMSYDNPCPFLGENGGCGIYANRPNACRWHMSMEDTEDPCRADEVRNVATLNMNTLKMAQVSVEFEASPGGQVFADVREFFPDGKGRFKNVRFGRITKI